MPRTKGSKNRPKTNTIKDYASQIAEKQETVASLNTEIASMRDVSLMSRLQLRAICLMLRVPAVWTSSLAAW